jgi:hypothetical protein
VAHTFVVIEGDNGVGKDTVASALCREGWKLINEEPRVGQALASAKPLRRSDRLAAFLRYNRICGETAANSSARCVQVRYWPSTLAAAFADGFITWQQMNELRRTCFESMMHPTLLLELKCDFHTRIQRIQARGSIDQAHDDMSEDRGNRRNEAINHLLLGLTYVRVLDMTNLTPYEAQDNVLQLVGGAERSTGQVRQPSFPP